MSLGYASRLTQQPWEDLGGQLGDPEMFDTRRQQDDKVAALAQMVNGRCVGRGQVVLQRSSEHAVAANRPGLNGGRPSAPASHRTRPPQIRRPTD